MKRLLFSLMLLTAFIGNVKGENYTWFPQESVQLSSSDSKEFAQEIWWHSDADNQHMALPDWAYGDFEFTSEVKSGDLVVTSLVPGNFTEGEQTKYGLKVTFTGSKGVIEITAANYGKHDDNTYICKYVLSYGGGSKRWDFNTRPINPEATHFFSSNQNFGTTLLNFVSGTPANHFYYYPYTRDNVYEFFTNYSVDQLKNENFSERSTNYLGVAEAEGLFFGFYNGNCGYNNGRYFPGNTPVDKGSDVVHPNGDQNKDENCYTRFLSLKAGSVLFIPKEQFAGFGDHPRIKIKMNRDGQRNDGIDLNVYNALDALGNKIDEGGVYRIGGCAWWSNYSLDRAEYHFIVEDASKNFVIRIPNNDYNTASAWLLLYTIEIYDSEELVSENAVLDNGQNYELLNTYKNTLGSDGQSGTYHLHYYGKGERTACTTNINTGPDWKYWPTGTVTCDNSRINSLTDGLNHKYTSKVGEFGTFNLRIECQTFDLGNNNTTKYCTDYATRSMAVGYLDKKTYPYTWDFTDVAEYENQVGRMGRNNDAPYGEGDYSYYNRWEKRYHWEQVDNDIYGHRLSKDATSYDRLYCRGSQLWYGSTLIPEIEGLGFSSTNVNGNYNSTLQILPTGLKINQEDDKDWCYRMTIPEVPSTGVVYARVHPDRSDEYFNAGYSYGETNFKEGSKEEIKFSATENNASVTLSSNDGTDDVIYVIPGDGTNLTLYFNGVTIKKIAVSLDPKAVNIKGWASESRKRVIDPELTGYMTGTNLQTFIVDQQEYGNTVTLTRVDNDGVVMDAVPESGDNHAACIIFNNDPNYTDEGSETEGGITPNKVEILDGQFHLFVPDMHDYGTDNPKKQLASAKYPNNQLMSAVNPNTKILQTSNGYTNYALSYKGYGEVSGKNIIGKEGFYRIQKDGVISNGNQAYLPVLSSADALMFNLSFGDEDTEIDGIKEDKALSQKEGNSIYYNVNGQRIQGQPTTRGLYIVNGKKVIVK